MTSWRASASPRAQRDLPQLLDPSLEFAQQQLERHGEFYPYAVVIASHGRTEMIAPQLDSTDDNPLSNDVIDACRAALIDRRDQLRAVALVSDVNLPTVGSDAIQVQLEHAEGTALTVHLPYRKRRRLDDIDYRPLRASSGVRIVWLEK
jgi:hypothetical protein